MTTIMTLAAAALLFGAALSRFMVFILIPISAGVVLIAALLVGAAYTLNHPMWPIVLTGMWTIIALQVGYLIGSVLFRFPKLQAFKRAQLFLRKNAQ